MPDSLAMRAVLAMLYSIAGRGRSSFYDFWRALRRPVNPKAYSDYQDEVQRRNELTQSWNGILLALDLGESIAFGHALGRARRVPLHERWFELSVALTERDAEHQRFAELLRASADEDRAAARQSRTAR